MVEESKKQKWSFSACCLAALKNKSRHLLKKSWQMDFALTDCSNVVSNT